MTTKFLVLDIMKYKIPFLVIFLLGFNAIVGQNKYEKEVRISKSEFPSEAFDLVSPYMDNAKRIRFYKETDSLKQSFELKFKKGKLHYSVEFDIEGKLEDVEFIIQPTDVPELSWENIKAQLKRKFEKHRIRKIQQQYPSQERNTEMVLKDAFQNLILPYINYELVFSTKETKGYQHYEALFDANGNLIRLRKSFPANYEHILY